MSWLWPSCSVDAWVSLNGSYISFSDDTLIDSLHAWLKENQYFIARHKLFMLKSQTWVLFYDVKFSGYRMILWKPWCQYELAAFRSEQSFAIWFPSHHLICSCHWRFATYLLCRYNLCNCLDSGDINRRLQICSCWCKCHGFTQWY